MATLILLRGNSGSGKSTVARALQQHFGRNTLLIPQDTVRREMLYSRDLPDGPTAPLIEVIARYGAEHCPVTIVEGILYTDRYDSLFRAMAAMFDHIHAYYFDISFEETLRRHETRPQRTQFGPEHMRSWWLDHDLTSVFTEAIIPEPSSLEETVARIIADVERSQA
ncbi:MAG: kinase [Christensenellaceae bacterium]|nr:kinase [Christensenellaceae bacterium]